MNVFELWGQIGLKGSDKVNQNLSKLEQNAQKLSKGLKIAGAAFTAVGAAGLVMIQSTKVINAQLGVTALNLGVTTKRMRELTLATTNVTFPIKEVTATFDLLARAGVKDVAVLKATATAFDTLGDATDRSASQVTQMMIPAMKTFGLTATEMAKKTDLMTYMSRQSTMTMEDFNTMVGYTTPELVKAGLTMEDLTAALIYMERQGYAPGRVMTREFMKATTLATKEQIPLTEALGMTTKELKNLKDELEGATGMTEEYAKVANEQYTIMDKLKQKWSELTLMASEYLEPLEPILAGMTALGPLMIGLSMVGIPKLIIAVKALGHTLKTLLLNPVVALIAALVALGVVTYNLIQHDIAANKVNEARAKIIEELAKSEGKLTEEVLLARKAYNELALASGLLSDEQEELVLKTQETIAMWEDGKYVLNEITGALELYGDEMEAAAESTKELAKETDKVIDKQKELLGLIGEVAPKGMTEKQLKVFKEIMWAKKHGITEVGGYAPGTVGFMRALGYPEFQHGGIITKPTLALLGEQAPRVKEFVFNEKQLNMLQGINNPYAIVGGAGIGQMPSVGGGYKTANIYFQVEGRTLARLIGQPLIDELRLKTGIKA